MQRSIPRSSGVLSNVYAWPLYTKARNRLKADKREKLLLRYNELCARHRVLEPDVVDPHEEISKYGDGGELRDPKSATSPATGPTANEAVRQNVFKCYPEPDE